MEDKKITLIIASSKSKEEKKQYIETFTQTCGCEIEIIFIGDNKNSLSEVYQQALDNATSDFVVFTHDDVTPLKPNWGVTIINLFKTHKEFGIIGVAGSKHYGLDKKIEWWYSKNIAKGMIFHGTEEKSWFSMFSPYNLKTDLDEVSVIDGVFIACNKNRLKYGFDTEIKGFHFYDIAFCTANFGHCKIGVTDRICLRHESVGQPNEEFIKQGLYVQEKYKDKLPLKIFN